MSIYDKGANNYHQGLYSVGLRNVGSYQVSGTPWITGSANLDDGKVHMVEFPTVPKSFTVINNNSDSGYDIRVHFQSGSAAAVTVPGEHGAQTSRATDDVIAGHHYITVTTGYSSVTFDTKCQRVYISNGSGNNNLKYQVLAELTNIPIDQMYHLTGSGITQSPQG